MYVYHERDRTTKSCPTQTQPERGAHYPQLCPEFPVFDQELSLGIAVKPAQQEKHARSTVFASAVAFPNVAHVFGAYTPHTAE